MANNVNNFEELNIAKPSNTSVGSWSKNIESYAPEILVVWLDKKSSLQLIKRLHGTPLKQIYLSSRLMNLYKPEKFAEEIPSSIRKKLLILHPV